MVAFNELADDKVHDAALAEPHDVGAPDLSRSESEPTAHPDNSLFQSTSQAHPNGRSWRGTRALLKPLIAIVTTQDIIVLALAGLAAAAIAYEAAHIINIKFNSIIQALKQF